VTNACISRGELTKEGECPVEAASVSSSLINTHPTGSIIDESVSVHGEEYNKT